jgi:site-specific DNA recombinase
VPLGYRVESRQLILDDEEAEIVKLIFERYLGLGSLPALQQDLREKGIRTRGRKLSSGRRVSGGGSSLTRTSLSRL